MFHFKVLALVGALLIFCTTLTPVRADETAEAGRKIVDKWQETVVTLEIVSKSNMAMMGEDVDQEEKSEARGVIIDPTGLVVTALSAVDPMSLFSELMGDIEMEGEDGDMSMTSEITGVKIILADGKSLQGQVVLRDKDLDLAFIRPLKAPEKPLPSLTPEATGIPQLFDPIYILDRLGTSGNRTIAVMQDRVKAVVNKPRRFYVLSSVIPMTGIPVFTSAGDTIGMLTLRLPPKGMKQSSGLSMMSDLLITTLPIADIYEAAKQAPAVDTKKK